MKSTIGWLTALAIALASTASMSGCASSTTITSDPDGAVVQIDGQPVGATPVSFTNESVWVWTKHQIRLQAKGYQDYNTRLNATVSPVHLVFGILCCLPLVLIGQYKERYHYRMMPLQRAVESLDWQENAVVSFSE